jgi:hypothetical protein
MISSALLPKQSMHFYSVPNVPHAPPISSLIWFFLSKQPDAGQGRLFHKDPMYTYSETPVAETSIWQPHNIHRIQRFLLPTGFEPSIPTSDRPQTIALDRLATGIGLWYDHPNTIWRWVKNSRFSLFYFYDYPLAFTCLNQTFFLAPSSRTPLGLHGSPWSATRNSTGVQK